MIELLLVLCLSGVGIGLVIFLRYQAPGRKIARARRRESAAYRKRMSERSGQGPDRDR